ncbi:MAG: hypothetical protein AB7G13_30215 [Lautropia sp.]
MSTPRVYREGNTVPVSIGWFDKYGAPSTPVSVRYRVFSAASGAPVSAVIPVAEVGQTMEIQIPGAYLPALGERRHLKIQIEATFAFNEQWTAPDVEVIIEKRR